jgi:hypothetical protein
MKLRLKDFSFALKFVFRGKLLFVGSTNSLNISRPLVIIFVDDLPS